MSLAPTRVSDAGPVCTLHYHDLFLVPKTATARPGEPCTIGFGSRYTIDLNAPGMPLKPLRAAPADAPMDLLVVECDPFSRRFALRRGGLVPSASAPLRTNLVRPLGERVKQGGTELVDNCQIVIEDLVIGVSIADEGDS